MNTYDEYLAAKKLFDTYELREADNSLTVDSAYDLLIGTEVRTQRNKKLAETDWTQLADSSADTAAWATYRAALRDLPTTEGFPHNVTWPTEPS